MKRIVDPDGELGFELLIEHRPDVFAQMLSDIPPKIMEMMLRKSRQYDEQVAKGEPFMQYFRDVCTTKTFSHDWFSTKAWAWHDLLAPYSEVPTEVLEVGVFEGRSVIFILEALRQSRITALDHFVLKKGWTSTQGITLEMDSEEAFRRNTQPYGDRVRTIVGQSSNGLTQLTEEEARFDIIYIDAAHTMPDVMIDSLLAWRLLKSGGLFIWDDFLLDCWDWHKGPVGPGVAAFLRTFPNAWETVHAGWQVIVRKRGELSELH
ncbi:MAG: class I SAM-dependent methyltransferase [Rhodopila sp.]